VNFASSDLDPCGRSPNSTTNWIVYTKRSSITAVPPSMTSSSNKLNLTTKTSTSNWISHRRVQFAPLSLQAGQAKRVEKIIPHTPIVPDSTHSFIERRATQVNEMIAGKVKMKSTTTIEPWKEASPKILQLWKDRHPAYQNFSSHYMASQRRMLFLADVNPSDRFEAFETICFKRNLAPTTAETYWSTWLGIQKALVIKPSDADHRITKILKARSMAYPVQFPTPITLSEMDLLVSTFDASLPSLAAIAMTTFLLGQRISDMIQLAVADLKSNDDYLTITVRRGKTMQVTTPYSLWLRRKTYPTETLIELAASAKSCGRLFLFTNLNSEEERQRVSHTVRDMLTSINDQLELRSLRRGGLQRMAHLGVSIPTMLHFSRHSDVPMLMRYLSWGQHATHLQNQMIEVVDMTTKEMNTSERIRSEATSMMQ
jgi:integrase